MNIGFTCWMPCIPRRRFIRFRIRLLLPCAMKISRQYFSSMCLWMFSMTTSLYSWRSSVIFMSMSLRLWSQVIIMVAAMFSVCVEAISVSLIRLRMASRKASERL